MVSTHGSSCPALSLQKREEKTNYYRINTVLSPLFLRLVIAGIDRQYNRNDKMERTLVKVLQFKLTLILFILCQLASSSENLVEISGVIEVTTRTFDAQINDGSSWMIEFYAPW
jgi:hypothetical protein